MLIADDVVIDPLEAPQTPARVPLSLSEMGLSVLEFRPGEAAIDGTAVRTATGQRLVDRRSKVTTIEMILEVKQDADVDLPTAAYRLQQKFGSMQERETWIKRVPEVGGDFAGPILYKVTGVVSLGDFAGWGRGEQPDVRLVLERDPVGYSTEETESEVFKSASGERHLIYTLPPSDGTADGLRRIQVTNKGVVAWRGLIWAEECRDYKPEDPTAELAYQAVDLTPKGGAALGGPAPQVRAVGTAGVGTGVISPGLPSGTQIGDLLIMVAESGGPTELTGASNALTATGWSSPPSPYAAQVKGNTRLTILYRIAEASNPTLTNDTGDHQIVRIVGIKAGTFDPDEPFNTAAVGTQAATKAVSIPGGTTTRPNCLIVACASGNLPDANSTNEFGAATNASLESVTERVDNTSTVGDGGALYAATGVKASPGTYSATTLTAVTEAERGVVSLAVNPLPTYVEHSQLTAGWVTVLSSEIAGIGHMTHRGARRLWIRSETLTGDPQLQVLWRPLGSSRWAEDNPVVSAETVGEQLYDLGSCRPRLPEIGDERWEWKLMACAPSGAGGLRVLDVCPLPTEQYMVLREPYVAQQADSQSTRSPGTAENKAGAGTKAWTEPAKVVSSDNEPATVAVSKGASEESQFLQVSTFAFGIPESATVTGIGVMIERRAKSNSGPDWVTDADLYLMKAGSRQVAGSGKNKADSTINWPTTDTPKSYGGSSDLWANTWTPAEINDSGFGAAFRCVLQPASGEQVAYVDHIQITVYYTEEDEEDRVCFASRSVELGSSEVVREHLTDDVWGIVVPDGFLPYDPPGGLEERPSRGIVIASQGDLGELPDSGSNSLEVTVRRRASYHFAQSGT